jgi:hypothetical protein
MTATLSARLDQLDAERADLIKQAARETLMAAIEDLRATCDAMTDTLAAGDIDGVRRLYDGSKDGLFWGPVLKIKATMGKLK